MNHVGHDFLAGAAFARDEHRDVAGRDALNGLHHRLHLRGLEDGRVVAAQALDGIDELVVLLRLLLPLQRALDEIEDAVVVRLGLEMKRAALGRLDGVVQRAKAGEDDDLGVWPVGLESSEEFETVGVRELEIEQCHLGLLAGERRAKAGAIRGFHDLVTTRAETLGQNRPEFLLIIYQ